MTNDNDILKWLEDVLDANAGVSVENRATAGMILLKYSSKYSSGRSDGAADAAAAANREGIRQKLRAIVVAAGTIDDDKIVEAKLGAAAAVLL